MPPAQGRTQILGTICGRRPQNCARFVTMLESLITAGCTRFVHLHCRIETMYCRSVVFQTRNF